MPHDFETQIAQARALTDEELLQAQGGSIFSDTVKKLLGPILDPYPTGKPASSVLTDAIHRVWEAVRQVV